MTRDLQSPIKPRFAPESQPLHHQLEIHISKDIFRVTSNIKYLAAYRKRNSGIARCSQRGCVRCALLVERSEFVPWSRLSRQLLALFPGRNQFGGKRRGKNCQRAESEAFLQYFSTA